MRVRCILMAMIDQVGKIERPEAPQPDSVAFEDDGPGDLEGHPF
jgi:hypothetical protein